MVEVSSKVLQIALTFDAEMDAFDSSVACKEEFEWRGIELGIPLIESILSSVRDSHGNSARATWFVRCDDQIGHITGDAAYLLNRYRDLWIRRQQIGDQIGFHPHLYRELSGRWRQDSNPETLREQIFRAYDAMQGAGFQSSVSRIGEGFGANSVMSAVEECGILCDSTAMPGRVRVDAERCLDWEVTPAHSYHPSIGDYRVPGARVYKILEVPMSMVRTFADYDNQPLMRYLDLSFHTHVLRGGLAALVANANTIVTVTHPSTILPRNQSHGLLSFSADVFVENLHMLLRECIHQQRPFHFVTLSDCAEVLS